MQGFLVKPFSLLSGHGEHAWVGHAIPTEVLPGFALEGFGERLGLALHLLWREGVVVDFDAYGVALFGSFGQLAQSQQGLVGALDRGLGKLNPP